MCRNIVKVVGHCHSLGVIHRSAFTCTAVPPLPAAFRLTLRRQLASLSPKAKLHRSTIHACSECNLCAAAGT